MGGAPPSRIAHRARTGSIRLEFDAHRAGTPLVCSSRPGANNGLDNHRHLAARARGGSNALHEARVEIGAHGVALFLTPDAPLPFLDIDCTREILREVVERLA